VGAIAHLLLCGAPPFDEDTRDLTIKAINAGELYFEDPIWQHRQPAAMDFIESCLTYAEQARPNVSELL